MLSVSFIALTLFVFAAIAGGIIGIILEGTRIPQGSLTHNPATQDTVFPIIGWATLFLLYLLIEFVGAQNLTPELRMQLGTLAVLPFFYAVLSTAWLIWRSARRIDARLRGREPVAWRAIPFLGGLRFPVLFVAAILSLATQFQYSGFALGFFLMASVLVLLALIRKP